MQNFVEENNAEAVEVSTKPQGEMAVCPFCKAENEAQAYMCQSCRSLLTLSDIEMILAYQDADQEILRKAVEQMEVEEIKRGLESDELVTLAIGHINMKNLRKGLEFLQKASKLDTEQCRHRIAGKFAGDPAFGNRRKGKRSQCDAERPHDYGRGRQRDGSQTDFRQTRKMRSHRHHGG